MTRLGQESGKVIWLKLDRESSVELPTTAGGVAALFVFLIAISVTAELMANMIAAWIGHQQSVALSLISTSGFL